MMTTALLALLAAMPTYKGSGAFTAMAGAYSNTTLALAKSHDRDAAAILDANGQVQTTGYGVTSNTLDLDPTNMVRCLTCHSPHHADSNSLTEDL